MFEFDLNKLNSATKYPSIPTYHSLGERGMLTQQVIEFGDQAVFASEKIDGTNSRVIVMPDQRYLIGSRQDLLTAEGDLIFNPALGIVETLHPLAERCANPRNDSARVFFFETFGAKVTKASKEYTTDRSRAACRMFDVCDVPLAVLEQEPEVLAHWRENGGQQFVREDALANFGFELTPRVEVETPPQSIEATHEWLKKFMPASLSKLDSGAGGRPEGLVIRTMNRNIIAKIRFEDYERHARALKQKK